ncbi:MAG: hypothetical protein WBM28_06005 [Burkholderiales bacterium]
MYQRTSIAIVAASFAGCAGQAPQAPTDNSPANPTAVFETLIINSGILGALPFEINERHYVRADMRRDEHSVKGTGTFTGWFVTAVTGEGDAGITRLDRNVRWTVNNSKKEYIECPAHGCPPPPAKKHEAKSEARKQEPKQETEKGCTMRISSNNFDVKPTGQKRAINGFNTDQYIVAWVVKMQDPEKRTTTSTLSFNVWTTPVTEQMREAFDTEAAFSKSYRASAPRARPTRLARTEAGRAQVMPPEVTHMMLAYLSSLGSADRAAFASIGKRLSKIQGHPISTKIEWRLDGDACAPKEGSTSARESPPSAGSMLSGITGMFGSKKDEKDDTSILSFTIEVKSLKVEPVRDSVFTVPANYKLVR